MVETKNVVPFWKIVRLRKRYMRLKIFQIYVKKKLNFHCTSYPFGRIRIGSNVFGMQDFDFAHIKSLLPKFRLNFAPQKCC